MRALFDVNLLVALLDEQHVQHSRAHHWWKTTRDWGWASCPLTENGFIRGDLATGVSSFARSRPPTNCWGSRWPKPITCSGPLTSVLDGAVFNREKILGPKQLTDVYLLALAVAHGGCLATMDDRVPLDAVRRADATHLVLI